MFLDVAKRSNICCKANLKCWTNNVWSFGQGLRSEITTCVVTLSASHLALKTQFLKTVNSFCRVYSLVQLKLKTNLQCVQYDFVWHFVYSQFCSTKNENTFVAATIGLRSHDVESWEIPIFWFPARQSYLWQYCLTLFVSTVTFVNHNGCHIE